jgi:protein-L-isoaspartate(D-aspartate) O-methyltransferase
MTFMELEISLGHGVSMWLPKLEARALQSLRLTPTDRVLEVGSGSGYLTALLASLAEHVTSVEIVPELNAFAEKNLAAQHVNNVTLIQGDAAQGWQGSYNAIILTGSVPVIPEAFKNSLAIGGRLFAIVGDAPAMQAKVVTCLAPGEFKTVTLFETVVAPLQNALQPERFVF